MTIDVRRLVVGSVAGDLVLAAPFLPDQGSDVVASGAQVRPGGGYGVLRAAGRLGLPGALWGRLGTGPVEAWARARLVEAGIEVLLADVDGDQGFTVVLAEPGRSRTFITSRGAESGLRLSDLRTLRLSAWDALYVAGRDLLDPVTGPAFASWVTGDADAREALLVLDPGPLVADIPDAVLDTVLGRTQLLILDSHALALMGGTAHRADEESAARALLAHMPPGGHLLLRRENRGCLLVRDGGPASAFAGPSPGPPLDTAGAVLTGVFLAGLARLRDPFEAARRVGVAAGLLDGAGATSPTRAELEAALS